MNASITRSHQFEYEKNSTKLISTNQLTSAHFKEDVDFLSQNLATFLRPREKKTINGSTLVLQSLQKFAGKVFAPIFLR